MGLAFSGGDLKAVFGAVAINTKQETEWGGSQLWSPSGAATSNDNRSRSFASLIFQSLFKGRLRVNVVGLPFFIFLLL